MSVFSVIGKRLLVVEDDYMLAVDLQRTLEEQGVTVIGPVPPVKAALRLIESEPDLDGAILDINLGEEVSFPSPTSC